MKGKRRNWLYVDLDDTLLGVQLGSEVVGVGRAYEDTVIRFALCLAGEGFPFQQVREVQQAMDMKLCERHGFLDRGRFPRSMVLTYQELCRERGIAADPGVEQEVERIGYSVFTDYPYVPLPGALPALESFSHYYQIALVTKGDPQVQNQKLFESGIAAHVDEVFIVGHKDLSDWSEVTQKTGHRPGDEAWAIGDSVRSDLNLPVSHFWMHGLHVSPPGKAATWAFEKADYATPVPGRRLERIPSFADALSRIPLPH